MKKIPTIIALALGLLGSAAMAAEAPKPLKVLLLTGGCCHDYVAQKDILKAGLEKRANLIVDHVHTADKSTKPPLEIYGNPNWAVGYDVIIHDECSPDIKDVAVVEGVLKPHVDGIPGVNLHCGIHSYRTGTSMWFDYLGLQSSGHGDQKPITITYTESGSPITKGMTEWITDNEELYNNIKVWDTVKILARGKQDAGDKPGSNNNVIIWTHEYGPKKTRVFSTTLAHNNATISDDRYLELVTRGVLWAAGKLGEDGKASPGYGK